LMHSTDWFVTLQSIAGLEPSVSYHLDGLDQSDNLVHGAADIYSPRSVLLHNIYEWSGALRWNDYKLLRESVYTKCHSTWCPDTTAGRDTLASIQCSEAGNFQHPAVDFTSDCSYNREFCLFDIGSDPCEYRDIRAEQPEIYEMMMALLREYKSAEAPSLFAQHPSDFEAASPLKHGGAWSPWMDGGDEVLVVAAEEVAVETVVDRPQRLRQMIRVLAPSIAVLVAIAAVAVLLQIAGQFVRRRKKDSAIAAEYGAV